jgi:hypothetical protein
MILDSCNEDTPQVKQLISQYFDYLFVCLMVFNATFNNISVISWRSVVLVEKNTDLSQVIDKLYHSYQKATKRTQHNPFNQKPSKLDENKNSIYLSNMRTFSK